MDGPMHEPDHAACRDPAAIEPVMVLAPCWRCGTTLMQRLLNSSGQIIVYGEDSYLVNLAVRTLDLISRQADAEGSLRVLLEGNTEFWANGVLPNPPAYGARARHHFYRQLELHQAWSREYGFGRWGFKYPLDRPEEVSALAALVPAARIIYVIRNVFDVVRSAKARRFIRDVHELRMAARRWNRNVLAALASDWIQAPGALRLHYEELTHQPGEQIERLRAFCGIDGIREEVLGRRINSPVGPRSLGYSPNAYVEPEPLDEQEEAILIEEASEGLARAGYRRSAIYSGPVSTGSGSPP